MYTNVAVVNRLYICGGFHRIWNLIEIY